MRVTVIIPCYNEEKRLDAEAFRSFSVPGHDVSFLFVNDGSRDGTLQLLRTANFNVLDLKRNSGKAEAVRRGIVAAMESSPDVVGFWDADLATPLAELPSFLDIVSQRPPIEMVFGARVRLLGRDISRRPSRHYVGRVGATLIASSLGLAVYDTQCGASIQRLLNRLKDLRNFFDRVPIPCGERQPEAPVGPVPPPHVGKLPVRVWHDVDGSKVKGRDFVRALRDLFKIRRAYRMRS